MNETKVKKEITLYINNLAYIVNIDEELAIDIANSLPFDKNVPTRDLLRVYLQKSQELINLKKEIEKLSNKLPPLPQ